MMLEQQLLDRITAEDRDALHDVAHLLRRTAGAWNRIERGKQAELNAMHHEEGSLALCLRRAQQAVDELIAAVQGAGQVPH